MTATMYYVTMPPPSLPSLFHLFLAVSILPDWTLAPDILAIFFFTDLSLVSISLSLTPIPTSISPLFHLYLVGLLSPLLPTLPWFIISNNTHNINITYTPTPCRNCGAVTDYIYIHLHVVYSNPLAIMHPLPTYNVLKYVCSNNRSPSRPNSSSS